MPPASASTSNAGSKADAAGANDVYSSFPAVKTEELLSIFSEMGLSIGPEDIIKPQGHVAHRVFVAFLETLSGATQEVLDRTRHATLAQMEYRELYEDGLQILILFREVQAMMAAATIDDFQLSDMTRPNPKRFKKQMSALVNFFRFRSDRIVEFDELMANAEDLEARRSELLDDLDRQKSDLDRFKMQREVDEPKVKDLKEENARITDQLLQQRRQQKKLIEEIETLKSERETLVNKQQGLMEDKLKISERLTYLKARVVSSPKKMKSNVRELVDKVNQDTLSLSESENKARDFEERLSVLVNLDSELESCLVAMEQVNAEMLRTWGEERDYEDTATLCETRQHELEQLWHQLEQTSRKVKLAIEKNDRARKMLDSKLQLHQQRMQMLSEQMEQIRLIKAERMAAADAKLAEGDEIESKINELKLSYEAYCNRMQRQKESIEKAVHVYINTLTNSLDLHRFDETAPMALGA